MGSRRQYPGRCVEDHFARASSTLGEVGQARNQLGWTLPNPPMLPRMEEGDEIQGCHSGSVESQCAKSCAAPAFAAVQAKVSRLQAAISALCDADTVEKEHLERVLLRAQSGRGASTSQNRSLQ